MKKIKGEVLIGDRRISGLDVRLEEIRRGADEPGPSEWHGSFTVSPKDFSTIVGSDEPSATLLLADGREGDILIASGTSHSGTVDCVVEFAGSGPLTEQK